MATEALASHSHVLTTGRLRYSAAVTAVSIVLSIYVSRHPFPVFASTASPRLHVAGTAFQKSIDPQGTGGQGQSQRAAAAAAAKGGTAYYP